MIISVEVNLCSLSISVGASTPTAVSPLKSCNSTVMEKRIVFYKQQQIMGLIWDSTVVFKHSKQNIIDL